MPISYLAHITELRSIDKQRFSQYRDFWLSQMPQMARLLDYTGTQGWLVLLSVYGFCPWYITLNGGWSLYHTVCKTWKLLGQISQRRPLLITLPVMKMMQIIELPDWLIVKDNWKPLWDWLQRNRKINKNALKTSIKWTCCIFYIAARSWLAIPKILEIPFQEYLFFSFALSNPRGRS